MMQHPWKFSYFINAGTCIDHHYRPVEIIGFHCSKGNCQTQTVAELIAAVVFACSLVFIITR